MEIKRDIYLDRLIRREKNGLIKIVTGVRRCGKSYLLFNLFHNYLLEKGVREDHIIEIALDDRSNKELRDPDNMLKYVKERIVDKDTYYIILDEVQLLAEFEDILEHTADDALLKSYITAAVSYAESYQHIPEGYYTENPMPPTTEQAVIMLSSHFYESRDGSTGGFFADNTGAAQQVWNTVNLLLRLDRRWQV